MAQRQLSLWVINCFIVIAIVALFASVYLALARATIVVPGERERFKNNATITVQPQAGDTAVVGEVIPREYEISESFPVGTKTVKTDTAGGMVTIVNNYIRDQSLVKTTRLVTADGKLFRITRSVTIPAGGSVDVFAEADQPGDTYLVGPSKLTIPGLWEGVQDKIYAENKQAMTYDRQASTIITDDDVKKAEDILTEKILAKARDEFKQEYADYALTENNFTSDRITVIADPAVGKEASQVKITSKRTVTVVLVKSGALKDAAQAILITQLPLADDFIEIIPDSMSFMVKATDVTAKTAELAIEIMAWIRSDKNPVGIDQKLLAGKSRTDAIEILKKQGVTDAEIQLFPSWLPMLPYLVDHITVKIK